MVPVTDERVQAARGDRAQHQSAHLMLGLRVVAQVRGKLVQHRGRQLAQAVQKGVPHGLQGIGLR